MFAGVARALRPGSIFHLHEFVGPDRFQWTDPQLVLVNQYLDSLSPELRRLPSGKPKPPQIRPTIAAMIAADPSEAVRSSEIVTVLERYFDIIEARPLGGAILHLALGDIAQNFQCDNPNHCAELQRLFDLEDHAMRDGSVASDFVVVTALRSA